MNACCNAQFPMYPEHFENLPPSVRAVSCLIALEGYRRGFVTSHVVSS